MKSTVKTARYKENGFDLNLTYVTPRLIITANFYQSDDINQFRAFLNECNPQHRLFNFCTEPEYNIEADLDNVDNQPIPPGSPGAIVSIFDCCRRIEEYLREDAANVAVLHCKTGKDRSCMIAGAYLMYSGVSDTAVDAIAVVNKARSPHTLNALSGPSLLRYMRYFEKLLKADIYNTPPNTATYKVEFLRMTSCPKFSASISNCGCTPELSISVMARAGAAESEAAADTHWYPKRVFSHLDHVQITDLAFAGADSVKYIDIFLENYNILVRGDVYLSLFSGQDKMCQVAFHTSAMLEEGLETGYIKWNKDDIDISYRDVSNYTFDPSFKLELYLQRHPADVPALNLINTSDPSTDPTSDYGAQQSDTDDAAVARALQFMYAHGDLPIDESDSD